MRNLLSVLVLIGLAASTSPTAPPNPYPNELGHFKFYAKYLSPLEPYISDVDSVIRVLGSDQGRELADWRIQPMFVGQDNTWAKEKNVVGRLATIIIRPKKRVSMSHVKFPPEFTHGFGSVSEINVACDVYSDDSGLEYWIYAEDSASRKKGDLMSIEYRPSASLRRELEGSPEPGTH